MVAVEQRQLDRVALQCFRDENPNYRLMVGREVNSDSTQDLFTPTPLFGSHEDVSVDVCQGTGSISEQKAEDDDDPCFCAQALREVYVNILIEAGEAGNEGIQYKRRRNREA